MNKVVAILSLCVTAFFFQSCGGDSGLTLTVNSPTDGQVFAPGDTIFIACQVTDDVEVSSIQFNVASLGLNETLRGGGTANANFDFDITLNPMAALVEDLEIVITAFDNEGNTEEVKRKVNIR